MYDPTKSNAYVVLRIDAKVDPPVVVGAGVYSAPKEALTLNGNYEWADYLAIPGKDYEEACQNLRKYIQTYPRPGDLDWLKKLLGW